MRIAETEKYPHVTYFLSGGVETELKGEERQMVASPRDVATYDLKPEMSVFEITDKLTSALESGETDVALVNFANCDMVGHTGVFDAAVKAVEAVDQCLGKVLNSLDKVGGQALITADHGNSEQMLDYETGEPHTFHTTYPVPVVWYGPEVKGKTLREGGALCDLAPTVCKLAKISIPKEMTGQPLI
jgi:2,3-bisphosphoglycerate-independent phosphoglycerate mutase